MDCSLSVIASVCRILSHKLFSFLKHSFEWNNEKPPFRPEWHEKYTEPVVHLLVYVLAIGMIRKTLEKNFTSSVLFANQFTG